MTKNNLNWKDETLLNIKAWIFFHSVYVYRIQTRRKQKKKVRGGARFIKKSCQAKKKVFGYGYA